MSYRNARATTTLGSDVLRRLLDDVARLNRLSGAIRAAAPVRGGIRGSDGAVLIGDGFSVVRSGAGVYVVTFAHAFAAVPAIVACLSTTGATVNAEISVVSAAAGSFTVKIYNTVPTNVDSDFNFVAYP